ncbi:MAG: sigma 54-interacting transcriptional regulator [Pseudomonadota bacterium]
MKNSLSQYIDLLLKKRKISENSVNIYNKKLLDFVAFLGENKKPQELTKEIILDFMNNVKKKGYSVQTYNLYVSSLKLFLRHLNETLEIEDFSKTIKNEKKQDVSQVSKKDLELFIEKTESIEDNRKTFFLLYILLGMSTDNIALLKKQDLKLEDSRIGIRYPDNKKAGYKFYPISVENFGFRLKTELEELAESSKKYLFETSKLKPLTKSNFNYIFNKYKHLLPKECDTLLKLKNDNILIKCEIDIEDGLETIIEKRYTLKRPLGKGTYNQVYLAYDEEKKQDVALKLLDSKKATPKTISAFKEEFKILKKLNHPQIPKVYEFAYVKETNAFYFSMEYIDLDESSKYVNKLSTSQACIILHRVLDLLDYISAKNIIHYDINPSNIMLKERDHGHTDVKLIDFGLASLDEKDVHGTNYFIAPEIIQTKKSCPSSDLYSLGLTIYYLLTSKFPFSTASFEDYLKDIKTNTFITISSALGNFDADLEKIILKMIAYKNNDRYESPKEALKDIDAYIKKCLVESPNAQAGQKLVIPDFFGREKQLEILENNFNITFQDDQTKHEVNINLISGEPYIGKKRLIDEIANKANLSEIEIIRIELTKSNPLNSVIEYLYEHKKIKKDEFKTILSGEAEYKSSIIKKVSEIFLRHVSTKKTLLILEKLEFADKDILIFIRFFLNDLKAHNSKLLFVLSINSDSSKQEKILPILEKKSSSFANISIIELRRFSKEETENYLKTTFNSEIEPELLDYIYNSSGGNPGYIASLLINLNENAHLSIKNKITGLNTSISFSQTEDLVKIGFERLKQLSKIQIIIIYIIANYEFKITADTLFILLSRLENISRADFLQIIESLIKRSYIKLKQNQDTSSNEAHSRTISIIALADITLEQAIELAINKKDAQLANLIIAEDLEETSILDNKYKEVISNHYLKASNYQKAVAYLEDIAKEYLEKGLLDKAIEKYESILLSIKSFDIKIKEEYKLKAFINLSRANFLLGSYKKAEDYNIKALHTTQDRNTQLSLLENLGKIKTKQGFYTKGIELYDEALKIAKEDKLKDQECNLCLLKISALWGLASFQEAEKLLKELLKIKDINAKFKATLNNYAGLVNYFKSNLIKANEDFAIALSFAENQQNIYAQIDINNNIGLVEFRLNNIPKAIDSHKKALSLCEKVSHVFSKAQQNLNLGNCYYNEGNFGKALSSYQEAHEVFKDLDNPRETETALFNLALIYSEIGDNVKAESYAKQCQELAKNRENSLVFLACHGIYGNINLNKGIFHEAIKEFDISLNSFKELSLFNSMAELFVSKAICLFKLNLHKEMAENIDEALKLESNDTKILLESNTLKAKQAMLNSDLKSAKKYFDIIDKLNTETIGFQGKISFHESYASFHFKNGDLKKALSHIKQLGILIADLKETLPLSQQQSFVSHYKIKEALETINRIKFKETGATDISKIEKLIEITSFLSSESNLDKLLNVIIDNAILFSNAKRGFILLNKYYLEKELKLKSDDLLKNFTVMIARNIEGRNVDKLALEVSETILKETLDADKVIYIKNAFKDFDQAKSIQMAQLKSIISFPIIENKIIIGAVYLDDPGKISAFDDIDQNLIKAFAKQVSIAISNSKHLSQLKQKNKEIETLNTELDKRLKITEELYEKSEELIEAKIKTEDKSFDYKNIITQSPKMMKIFDVIDKIKDSDVPVLIIGESGTGKELIARAIHYNGARSINPFMAENCGAISATLIESELFGYVKGAFTDANKDKRGIFELANKGTVFLDEIGEMPLDMQKKLLRVLQQKAIRKVGGNKSISIDFRIISATNKNIKEMVEKSIFRNDLYFRINTVEIHLPPLRERKEDIPILINFFLKKINPESEIKIDKAVIESFMEYNWPGNIRELENEIYKLSVLAENNKIDAQTFNQGKTFISNQIGIPKKTLVDIEKEYIDKILNEVAWNKSQASKILDIDIKTLNAKISKYELEVN